MKNMEKTISESQEISACLSVLLRKNPGLGKNDPLRLTPSVLFHELCRAGALDDDTILDLKKTEAAVPVRFLKQLPYQTEYLRAIARRGMLCLIGLDGSDGKRHTTAFLGFSEPDRVTVSDGDGREADLRELDGEPARILWFAVLTPPCTDAPEAAVRVVQKALSYIGTVDEPLTSCRVIFNDHYLGREKTTGEDAWCVAFIWDIFRMCGLSSAFYDGGKTQDCPDVFEWAQREGLFVETENARCGDLLIYNFSGDGSPEHIGIAISRREDGSFLTIEGNTSDVESPRSGHVCMAGRSPGCIIAAVRPLYGI